MFDLSKNDNCILLWTEGDPRPFLMSDGADANVRPKLTLADHHPVADPAQQT